MTARSPHAGTRPDASMLIDVAGLLAAYHHVTPDPADPGQRVSFGTSGHRGTATAGTFNETHVLAIAEAICRYRSEQGITGPLFLGRDTHALSEPAGRNAVEVLAAHGVDVRVDVAGGPTPTPAISHAILTHNRADDVPVADGVVITPSHNPPEDGGFKYNPPNGGPADTSVTRWIQDEANRLLERAAPGFREPRRRPAPSVRGGCREPTRSRPRLHRCVRGRPRSGDRHGRHPRGGRQPRCRAARRGERAVLACDRRALRP